MIRIEAFQTSDFAAVVGFVEAIQEHEREQVPELKPGPEIGKQYAEMLMRAVAEHNGCVIMARADAGAVGFVCAWIARDDDPLIRDDARLHAYVSDIFVDQNWRRQGIASLLMDELEANMRSRGCSRIRVCAKAANQLAVACYTARGYQPYEIIFTKRLDNGALASNAILD
jgi:ribosomal protein S18 acetylase RimI-like enzyme